MYRQLPALILSALLVPSLPASALDFTVTTAPAAFDGIGANSLITVTITATGEFEPSDPETFDKLLNETQLPADVDLAGPPVVSFSSGGGRLFAGLLLGEAIRAAGFDTFVPEGAVCMSACSFAFLGGNRRSALGEIGVHAISLSDPEAAVREGLAGAIDDVQWLAQLAVDYTARMTGDNRMALKALETPSGVIYALNDGEMTTWRVITEALRPAQTLVAIEGPLSTCSDPAAWTLPVATMGVLCRDLGLARTLAEIEALTDELSSDSRTESVLGEQAARFDAAWIGCATRPFTGGLSAMLGRDTDRAVRDCMAERLTARATQLRALRDFYAATDTDPAMSEWVAQPLP